MKIIDKTPLLTPTQKSLLERCASKPFRLGDFVSLDNILTKLNVDVHIESGKPTRSVDDYYDKAREYWRKEYEKLLEMHRRNPENEYIREKWQKAERKLGRSRCERKAHLLMRLLGLYDSEQNAIILFPEAMAEADASKIEEYLVSTFAHEVMHAYFNRPGHEKYPYALLVEEPLAEFGMLLYLHETHSKYYNWAHDNVSGKECCYGYGAIIMDQYLGEDSTLKRYLEEYKIPIGKYQMLDFSNGRIDIPKEGDFVDVADQPFVVEWTPVYSIPPTYFWDEATKTLGLDGDWRGMHVLSDCIHIWLHYNLSNDIEHLYIGKDYICDSSCRDFDIPTMVSPKHKELTSINGILVRKEDYKDIESFGEGYFKLKRDDKWGILDSKLKPITPFKYDKIEDFDENGLCEVKIGNLMGLVNKQGVEQVPVEYEDIELLLDDETPQNDTRYYKAVLNNKWGIIDSYNNKITQIKYDQSWRIGCSPKFDENGLCKVKIGRLMGLVNKQGVEQVPVEYEDIELLHDYKDHQNDTRYYKAVLNKKWGIIDSYNNPITQFKYDDIIWWFDENGLCKVKIGELMGLVNKQGVEQVPVEYEDIELLLDDETPQNDTRYYKAVLNNKWGIIDSYNNKITQIKYDKSIYCRHEFDESGLCEVKIGKSYGLVNKQGVEQIPVVYEKNIIRKRITYVTSKGEVTRRECEYGVKLNGEEFTINKFGKRIKE